MMMMMGDDDNDANYDDNDHNYNDNVYDDDDDYDVLRSHLPLGLLFSTPKIWKSLAGDVAKDKFSA